jgi:DNA-binding CsgD family transcriptional regulator
LSLLNASSKPPSGLSPVADDAAGLANLLMRVLDEVDYALMLFKGDQTLSCSNHMARVMLGRGGRLKTRVAARQSELEAGFIRAGQGIRCMLQIHALNDEDPAQAVALVPMGHPAQWTDQGVPVLLIACRPSLCAPLSLRFFAQTHGLTRTEEAVLADLVQGQDIEDIARHRNMAMATARSHVKQLRLKTRSSSMREMLGKLAVLPPVVSAVRALGP